MKNYIMVAVVPGLIFFVLFWGPALFTIDKNPDEPPEIVLFILGCFVVSCVCYSVYYLGLKFKAWRHRKPQEELEDETHTTDTASGHSSDGHGFKDGDEFDVDWRVNLPPSRKYSEEENEAFRRERKQILEEIRREEAERNKAVGPDSEYDDSDDSSGDF